MRSILINPFDRIISQVDIQPGLDALYAALSGPGFPQGEVFPTDPRSWAGLEREPLTVDMIDIISLGGGQDLVIDDSGRLKDYQACFGFIGSELLIAGRALIVGHDGEGETIGTELPLDAVQSRVVWRASNVDYTPPAPVVVTFSSWEAARAAGLVR